MPASEVIQEATGITPAGTGVREMNDNIALISEREVFTRTFRSGISHIFWFGLGAVVTWIVGRLCWQIGVVFFAAYMLLLGVILLWVFGRSILPAFVTALDAIGSRLRGERVAVAKAGYIVGALLVGVIEAAAGMVVMLILFNFYLKSALG